MSANKTPAGSLNLNLDSDCVGELLPGCICIDLTGYEDQRGRLVESFRMDHPLLQQHITQMAYVSMTRPLQVRGPHEHKEQSDCFIFAGPGNFSVHLWENRVGLRKVNDVFTDQPPDLTILAGEFIPRLLLIPPGVVHAYRAHETQAWAMNLPNKLYRGFRREGHVDEIRYEASSRYLVPVFSGITDLDKKLRQALTT